MRDQRGAGQGKERPVHRTAVRDEDWEKLIDAYFGAGSTDEDLELVITPDVTDPALCDAMLDFMRVIRDTKFPGSDRVLADTVTEINKS